MLIDGALVDADSGKTFANINPATEAHLGEVADASVTSPRCSSVAGLMLANVLPDSASTSAPSMSIRVSGFTLGTIAGFGAA